MARIAIALLQPGMTVAEEVKGPGGQVIAGAGCLLQARHLTAFRTWGVATVAVVDDASAATGGPSAEERSAAGRAIAPRFAGQPAAHPAVRELFRIAVERQILRSRPR